MRSTKMSKNLRFAFHFTAFGSTQISATHDPTSKVELQDQEVQRCNSGAKT